MRTSRKVVFHFLLVANILGKVFFKKDYDTSWLRFFFFVSKMALCAILIKDVALNKLTWLIQSTYRNGKFLPVKDCL